MSKEGQKMMCRETTTKSENMRESVTRDKSRQFHIEACSNWIWWNVLVYQQKGGRMNTQYTIALEYSSLLLTGKDKMTSI